MNCPQAVAYVHTFVLAVLRNKDVRGVVDAVSRVADAVTLTQVDARRAAEAETWRQDKWSGAALAPAVAAYGH